MNAPDLGSTSVRVKVHERKPAAREGFLDTIRAIATIRVIVWHAFGTPVISFVVASMPTMFFVAGSLLSASLSRRDYQTVLRDRLRRLLIPFWLFAMFVLTVVAVSRATVGGSNTALRPHQLVAWIVPLIDPTASAWEGGWLAQPLWYLRAFLWLLLAAPILRHLLRRFGNLLFVPPVLVVYITDLLIRNPGLQPPGFSAWRWYTGDFALYSIFLMLGFRHREGAFRNMGTAARLEWGAIAGLSAVAWCVTQPLIRNVVNNSYPAHLLVGGTWLFAFLALEPVLAKGPCTPIVGPVIRWLTQRSLTVYLWHTTTIAVADFLLDKFAPTMSRVLVVPIVVVLLPCVAALAGWAEDIAAGRTPRLWPSPMPFRLPKITLHPRLAVARRSVTTNLRTSSRIVPAFGGFGLAMALIAVTPGGLRDTSASASSADRGRKPPAPSARPDTAVFEGSTPRASIAAGVPTTAATASPPTAFDPGAGSTTPAGRPATNPTGPPTWTPVAAAKAEKLQVALEMWMKEMQVTGAAVAVGLPDGTLWNAGSGAMKADEQFDATSITKTFTSALILKLADEGKIQLDGPLPAIASVPNFPLDAGITPRQLLQHTSGLTTYQDTPEYLANPGMDLTPAQAVALAAKEKLLWPPGTNSGYSSSGYLTAGLLAEQAGGETFRALLEKNFFVPLGLKRTFLDETPVKGWIGFSTGGIKTTATDLVTWGAALYRDTSVFSADAGAAMVDASNDWSVGLGSWPVCPCRLDAAGTKVYTSIGHNGGSGTIQYSPSDGVVIAAFLNEPIFNSQITQQDLYDLLARLRVATT